MGQMGSLLNMGFNPMGQMGSLLNSANPMDQVGSLLNTALNPMGQMGIPKVSGSNGKTPEDDY
jgi:hypothetical protein